MMFNETKVRNALAKSWSLDTARQWTEERPFEGQCNVTAAVIADIFGGEILKTPWNEQTDHYYNQIDGSVYDLTDDQFEVPIHYANVASSKREANSGFTEQEYTTLREALLENLGDLT